MTDPDPFDSEWPLPIWTEPEQTADDYQREQIASANSLMPDDEPGEL